MTYPEVNIEVACAAELAIANLEGNSHLVILAEVLVEAFEAVGRQDDVVCSSNLESNGGGEERPRYRDDLHGDIMCIIKEKRKSVRIMWRTRIQKATDGVVWGWNR